MQSPVANRLRLDQDNRQPGCLSGVKPPTPPRPCPASLAGAKCVGRQIDPGNRLRLRPTGRRQPDAVHHRKGLRQGRPRLALPHSGSRSARPGRCHPRYASHGLSRLQSDHSAQSGCRPPSQPPERSRSIDGGGQLREPRGGRTGRREHRRQGLCPIAPRRDRSGRGPSSGREITRSSRAPT